PSGGYSAAFAQTTCTTARPSGRTFRKFPKSRPCRRVRTVPVAVTTGASLKPPLAACCATPGRAAGGGEFTCRQCSNRCRDREPLAQYYADCGCRQHGIGLQPDL